MDIIRTFCDIDSGPNVVALIPTKNLKRDLNKFKVYFSGFHGSYYARNYSLDSDMEKLVCKIYIDGILKVILRPMR